MAESIHFYIDAISLETQNHFIFLYFKEIYILKLSVFKINKNKSNYLKAFSRINSTGICKLQINRQRNATSLVRKRLLTISLNDHLVLMRVVKVLTHKAAERVPMWWIEGTLSLRVSAYNTKSLCRLPGIKPTGLLIAHLDGG